MPRPRRIDPLIVKRAHRTAATATAVESLRPCQAVLLPALFGATLEHTAHVLGVGRATVARLHAAFRKHGSAAPPPSRAPRGRSTAIPAHPGGRTRVLETVGGTRRHGHPGGGVPDSSGPGATAWPAGQAIGGVPGAGPPWLAQGGSRHTPPHEPPRGAGGLEKNSPTCGTPC